jgi:hypothetical protein
VDQTRGMADTELQQDNAPMAKSRGTWIRCFGTWALLLIGLKIWIGPGMADIGRPPQVFAGLLALLLACWPACNRAIGRAISRLQQWRMPWWMPLALGMACTVYCGFTAWRQDRIFGSLWQDDSVYEIQARMMARGRLWMPGLAVPDSFDSNYLFVRGVYASMYFPGAPLLMAPAVLLHLPIFIVPLLTVGAIGAFFCRIACELIDPMAGLIAPVLWISSRHVRRFSITPMSHPPVILFSLVAVWAWLRWRSDPKRRIRWAIIGGAAVGWAAITRPLDAFCLLTPLILLSFWELRAVVARRRFVLISTALLAAMPFLILMAVNDRGITGHWWKFPHEVYARSEQPGMEVGFHPYVANAEPESIVPQKRAMYDEVFKTLLVAHRPGYIWPVFWLLRLPRFLSEVVPLSLLIVLAMVGIAGVMTGALVVFVLPLFLLPIGLAFYAWMPDYYPIVVWPATAALMMLGTRQIGWLIPPARSALVNGTTILLVALALGSLPEFDRSFHDDASGDHLRAINRALDSLPDEPALVLFRYTPAVSYYDEPVYNTSVAWPDDARIVRAHDLGPAQNAKLFAYYAAIQPQRTVYLYDRPSDTVTRLGSVKDLADQSRSARSG